MKISFTCLFNFMQIELFWKPFNALLDRWACSFGIILIWISDPGSLSSWCIKRNNDCNQITDSSVPLMHHDPSDLGSPILILVIPKERTQRFPSLPTPYRFSPSGKTRRSRSCRAAIEDDQSFGFYIMIIFLNYNYNTWYKDTLNLQYIILQYNTLLYAPHITILLQVERHPPCFWTIYNYIKYLTFQCWHTPFALH